MYIYIFAVDMAAVQVVTNPWLQVTEPRRDSNFPRDRDRSSWHQWVGCISVLNIDHLTALTRTVGIHTYNQIKFSIEFGPVQLGKGVGSTARGCANQHTYFILEVIGVNEVDRITAYHMACHAFYNLRLIPITDNSEAFSYFASVFQRSLLQLWGMLYWRRPKFYISSYVQRHVLNLTGLLGNLVFSQLRTSSNQFCLY